MDALAETCQKAFEEPRGEVTAEVNVQNLPTVAWKGETFHVDFTKTGAVLYNGFGNVVQDVAGAKTVEDVDHFLNDNNVVATAANEPVEEPGADDEFYAELSRVMASDAGEEVQEGTEEVVEAAKETTASEDVETVEEPVEGSDARIEQLASKLDELCKTVEALSQQYYAYTAPANDAYDLNSQELEVQHFNEAAENTQVVIDEEHKLDLTRPVGRVHLNYTFLNNIFGGLLSEEAKQQIIDGIEEQLVEEPVEEPAEEAVEEPVEEAVEEPAEEPIEEPAADEPAEESVDVAGADVAEAAEDEPVAEDESETSGDSMVVHGEDVDEVDDGDVVEAAKTVEAAEGVDANGEDGEGQQNLPLDTEEPLQTLTPEQVEQFMQETCPICGQEHGLLLATEDIDDDTEFVSMTCGSCGRWYKVDLVTDEVSLVKADEQGEE